MRFRLVTLLLICAVIAMAIQMVWHTYDVWSEPQILVAGLFVGVIAVIGGMTMSHSSHTRITIQILAFLFYIALGFQWAAGFRDESLLWSFRSLCIGLLVGTLIPRSTTAEDSLTENEEIEGDSQQDAPVAN